MLGALIAVVLAGLPATVVHPAERAAFEAMLRLTALGADAKYGGAPICTEATVEPVSVDLIDIGGHPDIAAAHARVKVNGCGRSSVQNVSVARVAAGPPWLMAAAAPGDSLADPALQNDLLPILLAEGSAEVPKTCQSQELGNVYVAARPGHVLLPEAGALAPSPAGTISVPLSPQAEAHRSELDVSKAWIEVWPLKMCGLDRTLAVVFVPLRDKSGVFHAELRLWKIVQEHGLAAMPPPAPPD
jgi:hypothetical protein